MSKQQNSTSGRVILRDTDDSHTLTFVWNEAEAAADRTLNLKMNTGDRTIDLSGNLTVEAASIINQDLSTDATGVQFGSMVVADGGTIGSASDPDVITIDAGGNATFSVFPITPSAAPDADYEVANKKYVDDNGSGISNVVEDATPQLGGDLDLNGHNIDFPTTANINDCLDEDDMASDSATKLATQQSIKAFGDNHFSYGSGMQNLTVVIGTDTDHDVDIDFDYLQVGQYCLSSGNLTVAIDASGANGLDTGSVANNTWYSIFVIYNPATSTIAGLFAADSAVPSASNAPTLPSGYTVWRHVGWCRTDGSANIKSRPGVCNLAHTYHRYGSDPGANYDHDNSSDWTTTNSWTSEDVSDEFPPGTTAIDMFIRAYDNNQNQFIAVNTGGYTGNAKAAAIVQYTNGSGYSGGIVPLSDSFTISYYITSSMTSAGVCWRGYFM